MTATSGLRIERLGAVARLTLDRPEAANAIDLSLAQALLKAAIDCDEDETVRCVVLTGCGKFFCTGGDVASFAGAGEEVASLIKEITANLHMAVLRLAHMNKPLLTVVNGAAAGAGFSLAILGDLVLAARSASFALAYSGLGFTPDGGASWLLPRLVGLRQAQKLMLLRSRLSADEAAAMGLVTEVVDDGAVAARADELTAEIVGSAPSAMGQARALLLSSFETSLEVQLDRESRAIAAASRSTHGREGVAAFLAKRKPDFGGSN